MNYSEETDDRGVKISRGQVNFGTVGGAIGIGAALLAGSNYFRQKRDEVAAGAYALNNPNGGLGYGNCGARPVTQTELAYENALSCAKAETAGLQAERYTDQQVIKSNQQLMSLIESVNDKFDKEDQRVALLESEVHCIQKQLEMTDKYLEQRSNNMDKYLNERINNVQINLEKDLKSAIALEGERRIAGDHGIYEWVKATYVPGKLVMPAGAICPTVMQRYNSWTAPEDAAPTTVEVLNARAAAQAAAQGTI